MYIDWNELWNNFDEWFFDINCMCPECGRHKNAPEWEDQKEKIKELVESQLNQLV